MNRNHVMRFRTLGAITLLVLSGSVLLGCSGDKAMTSPTAPGGGGASAASVQIGLWGGNGIKLDVSDTEARVDFACAHAVLGAPIPLDSIGSFFASGTYFREGPGPISEPDVQGTPATFLGRVTGDFMKLSVTLDEDNKFIGSFELQRNKSSRIIKCQ